MAVDPGSTKCGIAVVQGRASATEILYREVVSTELLQNAMVAANEEYGPSLVVIGDGTKSKEVQSKVRECLPGKAILVMDEQETSLRARERYWEETPRRGWRRLLPSTLQVPPVPIDDFVAVILAERALIVDS